jgi:hypothetical protein
MSEEEIETGDEEGTEVEVVEFALYQDEIDELIEKLQELKKTKDSFEFDIDESNALKIDYLE